MAPITTSYDVFSGDETELAVSITTTQTVGIKLAAMNQNGGLVSFFTPRGVIEVEQSIDNTRFVEWISFGSIVTNADSTVTLGDVSRNIPRDGYTLTGTGTGQRFIKGAKVRLVTFHYLLNNKANLDRSNEWDEEQEFQSAVIFQNEVEVNGPMEMVGDTASFTFASMTTAERDALASLEEGTVIYNTDTGLLEQYLASGWSTIDSGTPTPNGSTTVAGKFEEATVAEQGTATATGGTGARLVPAVANLVKTSSGAADENKIPILDATGKIASGFSPTSFGSIFGDGSDGDVTISGATNLSRDMYYNSLTVNTGQVLSSKQFRIFVKNTLTLTGTAKISCGGTAGSNGSNGVAGGTQGGGGGSTGGGAAGGTAGAAVAAGYYPATLAGGTGAVGGNGHDSGGGHGNHGAQGTGNNESVSAGGAAGADSAVGGAGGAANISGALGGNGNTSGGGGTVTQAASKMIDLTSAIIGAVPSSGTFVTPGYNGGSSGGNGGGGGGSGSSGIGATGGGGGGGGSNAGKILVAAATITGSGTIEAIGGTGGNGGNGGTATTGNGGGGGGGAGGTGGSGGFVLVICQTSSGWSGTAVVTGGSGGTGGTPGTGVGLGSPGTSGSTGTSGTAGGSRTIAITRFS